MSNQSSQLPDVVERSRAFKRGGQKPVEVWYRAKNPSFFFNTWARFGRYKDEATALMVLQQKESDPYFEYEMRCRSTCQA